jgi:putative spermidine/putrescine transport system permease protein
MIFVLLPFWTSLLVRTTSWIVLLQQQGVINSTLVARHHRRRKPDLDDLQPDRHDHRDDAHPAALHGAAALLGHAADPALLRPRRPLARRVVLEGVPAVYFPLTIPGIAAGGLLVFILAVGYYITPALVGGASGQLISNLIAYHMTDSLNWSLAAALAAILLAAVLVLYWLYDRLIGIDNLKLG